MKVVVVMPVGDRRGGAEALLAGFAGLASSAGIELSVVFLQPGPLVDLVADAGIRVHVVLAHRLSDVRETVRAVGAIARIVRAQSPDVVLGWMTKAVVYAAPAAAALRVPLVMYQQGTSSRGSRLDRLATRLARAGVIVVSDASARSQRAVGGARVVSVVRPGIDLDRFDPTRQPAPAAVREELALPEAGPLIVMVSRLQRWKGVHVLVEALPAVRRAHPQASVVVVGGAHPGEADYVAELEGRARDLGLTADVRFVGLQQRPERFLQAADVVVHASDDEPFGMVVVEGMALGKPVVAARSGGPLEIITEGVDGLLSPVGDPNALAAALTHLLDEDALRERIGVAARERARAFSSEAHARRLAAVLRQAAHGPEAGALG